MFTVPFKFSSGFYSDVCLFETKRMNGGKGTRKIELANPQPTTETGRKRGKKL